MNEAKVKTRGAVRAGKRQINWRLRVDLLELAADEAALKHLKSTPALVEHILQLRYYPEQPSKKTPR